MYTRQTVLMFAGLVLVGLNAMIAGHWLNVKSAVAGAAGAGAPTLNLPSAGSVAGKVVQGGLLGAVKGTRGAVDKLPLGVGSVIDPLAPPAEYLLTPGNIGKIKKRILGMVP